ncbi:MAG TPA: ABC transporter ATP-binding protein [Bryobacteraceae bacterium]|nr:ABC transporter ATP-binding protein [Bryobacteraceae bacterium]
MEEEVSGRFYDGTLIFRLMKYLSPYRGAVALAVGCMMLHAIADIAGPLLTKVAIDRYLAPPAQPQPSWFDSYLPADPWIGLAQISALYLMSLLLSMLMEFCQTYLMNKTGQMAMFDLRRETMAHLQRLEVAFYDRTPVGRLLTRVTTDADALNELFASGLVALLGDILMLLLVLAVLVQLSPSLTLVLVGALPVVVAVTMRFRKEVTRSNRRIRTAVAKINSYLQEHISGMSVLQLFNREARSKDEFTEVNREHMLAYKEAIIAYGWFYPVVEFCGMATVAFILAWGGYRVREGELSLGVLVAFFQYGMRFFRPIQDLSEKYNILQSAAAAAERIFQLLDTPSKVTSPANPASLTAGPAVVEFDRVWFAYKDEDWVVRDMSFRIEPGETIAVVGHTGAGKTTLTNLLLRFYDVQRGVIRVGGVDIREIPLEKLRRRFAIVLQDSFLFTGSLEDNIRLGTPNITREQIERAVNQVNLTDFVNGLPDGLNHALKERGAGLSTGQKQLVSFARALAHDPVFLILDEATSSVDTETELRIRGALDRLVEGRTSLVIAHRLSTIQKASRIFVLHKGLLREVGTHQELLAERGIYWKLYQLQYRTQEVQAFLGMASPRIEPPPSLM